MKRYRLIRISGQNVLEIAASLETSSLIQQGKVLLSRHNDLTFAVIDQDGNYFWQGKSTPANGSASE